MQDAVVPEVGSFYRMPDEENTQENDWSMPDPVFRSSEGRDLKAERDFYEMTTEIPNADLLKKSAQEMSQTVRPKENRHIRHKNKRKKSFWETNARGLIVLGVFLLGALIYLAWLYRGKIF